VKIKKADEKFEGSTLIRPDTSLDKDTRHQSTGVIEYIDEEYNKDQLMKLGDTIHFSRYAAVRLNPKENESYEFWVLNIKDILCIEYEPTEKSGLASSKNYLEDFKI